MSSLKEFKDRMIARFTSMSPEEALTLYKEIHPLDEDKLIKITNINNTNKYNKNLFTVEQIAKKSKHTYLMYIKYPEYKYLELKCLNGAKVQILASAWSKEDDLLASKTIGISIPDFNIGHMEFIETKHEAYILIHRQDILDLYGEEQKFEIVEGIE